MEHSGPDKEVPYDDLLLRKAFGDSVQLYRTTPKEGTEKGTQF